MIIYWRRFNVFRASVAFNYPLINEQSYVYPLRAVNVLNQQPCLFVPWQMNTPPSIPTSCRCFKLIGDHYGFPAELIRLSGRWFPIRRTLSSIECRRRFNVFRASVAFNCPLINEQSCVYPLRAVNVLNQQPCLFVPWQMNTPPSIPTSCQCFKLTGDHYRFPAELICLSGRWFPIRRTLSSLGADDKKISHILRNKPTNMINCPLTDE